ncbi:MAG TPA: glycosyltransferase, partial [Sphingomonas sp.]|uniref:glycosyltransferase n=1 Tax=Sphingomonas sp. TaxID=28214 RepID=UPI002CC3C3C3
MRIAYVINSLEGGGASGPVPAVVNVLRSEGCDVRVLALTMRDGRGLSAIEQEGISVLVRERGETNHFGALQWLDRQILDWQPDLIWTSLTRATLLGQIVGQLHGIDVVSWQHSVFLKPLNALLLKLRHRRSIFWVADSDSVAALTHSRLGVAPERIAVWPLFAADMRAPLAAAWRPGMPLRIGSLGRLHRAKGYDVLIAALGRMRADGFTAPVPIEIEIAGDGALREKLTAQASALGVSDLRLIGFSEPKSFLAGLHLYVQPSRREGLCIAAHEAMQARLPVLASAVGELGHTILDRVTGRLVPPIDPDALARALADLLRDPDRLG